MTNLARYKQNLIEKGTPKEEVEKLTEKDVCRMIMSKGKKTSKVAFSDSTTQLEAVVTLQWLRNEESVKK